MTIKETQEPVITLEVVEDDENECLRCIRCDGNPYCIYCDQHSWCDCECPIGDE